MTRSTEGASRGASAGLPGRTSWSRTMPSSLSQTWAKGAELDRFPEPAFRDRPGVRVVQTDLPGRTIGHRPGQPAPGLLDDLPGRVQQVGQVVDGPDQTTTTPTGGRVTAAG